MIVVSNTSPIINLAAVDKLRILHDLYNRIYIPEAVFDEISVIGTGQPGSEEVKEFDWIITQKVTNQTLVKALRIELDRGEAMCFVHVLLNALAMKEKGHDVKIIIEGSATKLVEELADETKPFANLYKKVKDEGLIDCVCKACANKMNALNAAVDQQLLLCGELSGHPSMAKYMEQGFEIISF